MRERTRLADQVGRVRKLEQERADALEFAELAEAEGDRPRSTTPRTSCSC